MPGHAAEMIERILNTTNEVICRLSRDHLAVGLAGVAQDDAKDVGLAPLAVRTQQRGAGAEINLGLFARFGLEAPHREVGPRPEAMDEAAHAEITALESVLGREVLIDPLGRQAELDLGLDRGAPGLAAARSFGS